MHPQAAPETAGATLRAAGTYASSYGKATAAAVPDAYTVLLLDALRGRSESFVRSDELLAAWRIFDGVLHGGEGEGNGKGKGRETKGREASTWGGDEMPVHRYAKGSVGPQEVEAQMLRREVGRIAGAETAETVLRAVGLAAVPIAGARL